MRTTLTGLALLAVGAVLVATGVLASADVAHLAARVGPVLAFVVGMTVVTDLAARAGLFDAVAARVARWGRGSRLALWGLVVVAGAVSTAFLSLDTTAVLLTPVVVVLARHVDVAPLPFALTTVWLANAGSLWLPTSNLTNLLALHALGDPSPLAFARLTWAPALVATVVPMLVLLALFRRALTGRHRPEQTPPEPRDPVLLRIAGVTVTLLVPALVSGVDVWIPAVVAAAVLAVAFALRERGAPGTPGALRWNLVPWPTLVLVSGLFVVFEAAHGAGLGAWLARVAGEGEGTLDLLRVAVTGMLGANLVDNLPAYLALEPAAGSPARLVALLVGVNAGPLVTPWASLATLLWHDRLTRLGVSVRWGGYMALGLLVAPLTVLLATLTLAAML
ncbi:arsenic transporter [Flavimobilis sp. GY10621]|uniref:Arsenic transporter n=1 Tax=Flavimobilis rhizosphaerae TaxID=2775421 RepID=A0ABR9DVP5_9MICO|nr:SLC13 family permease [Flavimobilis rhizosphaerae]MBD9700075.1 arsenic transporter [Flavimobilis rhizosphaerae]